jgi:hypothetical protein
LDALPIVILAPLGAVSLIYNALLARLILGDTFGKGAIAGTALVAGGAVLIAVFGVVQEREHSLDELLRLFGRPTFVAFFSIEGFVIVVAVVTVRILCLVSRSWLDGEGEMLIDRLTSLRGPYSVSYGQKESDYLRIASRTLITTSHHHRQPQCQITPPHATHLLSHSAPPNRIADGRHLLQMPYRQISQTCLTIKLRNTSTGPNPQTHTRATYPFHRPHLPSTAPR